jgi:hypothetical protein
LLPGTFDKIAFVLACQWFQHIAHCGLLDPNLDVEALRDGGSLKLQSAFVLDSAG